MSEDVDSIGRCVAHICKQLLSFGMCGGAERVFPVHVVHVCPRGVTFQELYRHAVGEYARGDFTPRRAFAGYAIRYVATVGGESHRSTFTAGEGTSAEDDARRRHRPNRHTPSFIVTVRRRAGMGGL